MALDSKELMLEKFVAVNKERYPDFSDRLDQVSAKTITFDTIAADPNNPEKGRMSNLGSDIMFIEAEEQTWICASMNGDRVLNFTEDTIFSSLDEIVNSKARGIFKYQDGEEVKVAQLIPTLETDFSNILDISLLDINSTANYRLKKSEITMLDSPQTGYYEALVNGATIHGTYMIVCKNPDMLAVGDWKKGYYGRVLPSDFMSPELVAELVGVPTSKIIYQGQNIWLKFSYKGKTILIAQKPVASNITYSELVTLNLIEGNRVLTIKNINYGVRVPIGNLGATDYNEWEDLLYPMSANDPTGQFWEHFTNDELGVGLNSGNSSRYMGEWNWMKRTDLSMTSVTIRGGNASGITGATSSAQTSGGATRGFRPVLIMEGVSGIDTVTFKQINPKQLIPLRTGVAGTTDAYPIKNVKWKPWSPVPIYFSTTFLGDVYRITSVQTKLDVNVRAPEFITTVLAGSISRILELKLQSDIKPVYPTGYNLKDTIKGVFSIKAIQAYASVPTFTKSVNNLQDTAMGVRSFIVEPSPLPLRPSNS